MTFKESLARLEEDTQRIRNARLEFESAMNDILKHPHIDGDRTIGLSAWEQECDESARLNR